MNLMLLFPSPLPDQQLRKANVLVGFTQLGVSQTLITKWVVTQ